MHGLLGQTWSRQLHKSTLRYIEGEPDDYTVSGNELLDTDFTYTRWQAADGSEVSGGSMSRRRRWIDGEAGRTVGGGLACQAVAVRLDGPVTRRVQNGASVRLRTRVVRMRTRT